MCNLNFKNSPSSRRQFPLVELPFCHITVLSGKEAWLCHWEMYCFGWPCDQLTFGVFISIKEQKEYWETTSNLKKMGIIKNY